MSKLKHSVNETLLLVGEGYDEEAFLIYLKSQIINRKSGFKVKIKNAKGKGAKHVFEWTIRQIGVAEYDTVAVLLDVDTDWSEMIGKKAKAHRIKVLKSDPCFEAMLLRCLGVEPEVDTAKLKKQFSGYVNGASGKPENYAGKFNPELLKSYRGKEPTIDDLLTLLKV